MGIESPIYRGAETELLKIARIVFDVCVGIADVRDGPLWRSTRSDCVDEERSRFSSYKHFAGLQRSDGGHGLLGERQ